MIERVVCVKKKLISVLLSLALLVSTPNISKAATSIPVLLNGEELVFEVPPFIEDGTTMVPFRTIFEKLGFDVNWSGESQTVTGSTSELIIKLQIGSTSARVNGSSKVLSTAPIIKDGNTFVPLRFISETSGKKVIWDDKRHSVLIRDGLSSYMRNTLNQPSNHLAYTGNQKDGHGTISADGKIVYDGDFKDNKRSGNGTLFWLGGQKRYEGQWYNDLMNGTGNIYNEDGTLLYEKITMLDNSIEGNGTLYFSNGWIYKGEFVDGSGTGTGELLNPSGTLAFDGQFKDFQLEGQGKSYYANGKIHFEGEFHNDLANGQGVQYEEDGSIAFKGLFKNGVPVINKAETQEIGINFSAEPPVLDSSKATATAAFSMINAFNEGLYRLDKDGKVQLGLAKDLPKITNNGLTYTITLRDAKWNDGTPVKASDFVASWKRTLDPATRASYSFILTWIKGGEAVTKARSVSDVEKAQNALGVRAINDQTLEINLERPITYFTSMLAFPIFFPQRADFIAAQGDRYGAEADKVMGAGPFKLVKWDHGESLKFVKNENYWDAANVKLNKFVVNIVKDATTGIVLYESDIADISEINSSIMNLYKGKPDVIRKPELTTSYVMFQEEKFPAFANAKIRKALMSSIDREALIALIITNGSLPSTGYIPNGTLDGNNHLFRSIAGDDVEPKFDPQIAKELLAEGLHELGLTSLPPFKLSADDTETGKSTLTFIQKQWKTNLGITVTTEPLPHTKRVDNQFKHDFDASLALWGADYNDPMTFLDMWETGVEFNEVDWSNTEYDQLINAARQEDDPLTRSKLLVDAEKLLMEEMPIGPLYFRSRLYVKKPNVDGVFFPSFGFEWELKWARVTETEEE
ncbi:ABC transporter substrate-binding protein [Paenibacillus roseipurpureus]|uniref:ABC transporter substrate-binding protein n=1 Tax=Paenibacillus roseopurpureus TaxID=2918901 RepID=A0AA96LYC5_9BACL|nr:ABC transporter substrate-binding protein [Paenibacillus sp. MBLB1832]WNR46780.1 ABC transporter substrate-binding protein [Paenibacillus sp. MBLB1832]